MNRRALLRCIAAGWICLYACGAPADRGVGDGSGVPVTSGEAPADTARLPPQSPAEPLSIHPSEAVRATGVDRGRGVLRFAHDAGPGGPNAADTIRVLAAPSSDAPVVALAIFRRDSLAWGYALSGPGIEAGFVEEGSPADTLIRSGLLEYAYEESGLPIDTIVDSSAGTGAAPGQRWVRVVYGYSKAARHLGWVGLSQAMDVLLWRDELPAHDLFFADPSLVEFRDAPGGERIAFPFAPDPGGSGRVDYILHPLESDGDWLRVRAVTPSDYCADPVSPRDTTAWIRFLDAAARPRVWFFTRGC